MKKINCEAFKTYEEIKVYIKFSLFNQCDRQIQVFYGLKDKESHFAIVNKRCDGILYSKGYIFKDKYIDKTLIPHGL